MTLETLRFEIVDGIATLTFNRPRVRNAINMKMMDELHEVLTFVHESANIDILIITGNDQAFCAGADTTEFLEVTFEENQLFLDRFEQMIQMIEQLRIPVIGAINGYAFGGGAEVATACDFRVAAEGASFRFPGVSYGLVVSSRTLPTIVGVSKAKELLFRSSIVSTEEAEKIGLVDHVVPLEKLLEFTTNIAKEIQSHSKVAVQKVKEVINQGIGASMEERSRLEREANEYLVQNTNFRQTFSAFVEKRKKKSNKV